ncbi:hypothetical protein ACWA1C_01505 [Flectobacillus roseus]
MGPETIGPVEEILPYALADSNLSPTDTLSLKQYLGSMEMPPPKDEDDFAIPTNMSSLKGLLLCDLTMRL